MKCSNCDTPLVPGNNICPNCGALNMGFQAPASAVTPVQPVPTVEEVAPVETVEDISQPTIVNDVEMPQVVNNPQESVEDSTIISLDEDETSEPAPVITENMAPPTLDVNEDKSLTEGVSDIGSNANVSAYAPEGVEDVKTPEEIMETRKNESIDIKIPSSVKPTETVDLPSDGSAPSIDTMTETVGEVKEEPTIKIGGKKLKLNFRGKKSVPQLICIVGIIVFFIMGILIGSTMFTKNVCVSSNGIRKKTEKVQRVADGKNNVTKAGNYTFKIPNKYYYDKSDKGILIYDEEDTWRIYMRADNGFYENMASAKTSIKETLKDASIQINDIKEIKVEKTNFLAIEGTTGVQNRLIAFTDAKNDFVYYIEIVASDNNYDYNALSIAADIAKNAVYNEKESNMEKIPVKDISALAITAAEAHQSLTK